MPGEVRWQLARRKISLSLHPKDTTENNGSQGITKHGNSSFGEDIIFIAQVISDVRSLLEATNSKSPPTLTLSTKAQARECFFVPPTQFPFPKAFCHSSKHVAALNHLLKLLRRAIFLVIRTGANTLALRPVAMVPTALSNGTHDRRVPAFGGSEVNTTRAIGVAEAGSRTLRGAISQGCLNSRKLNQTEDANHRHRYKYHRQQSLLFHCITPHIGG